MLNLFWPLQISHTWILRVFLLRYNCSWRWKILTAYYPVLMGRTNSCMCVRMHLCLPCLSGDLHHCSSSPSKYYPSFLFFKLNNFGFWTFGRTEQVNVCQPGLLVCAILLINCEINQQIDEGWNQFQPSGHYQGYFWNLWKDVFTSRLVSLTFMCKVNVVRLLSCITTVYL